MSYFVPLVVILLLLYILIRKNKREEVLEEYIETLEKRVSILERIVNIFTFTKREQEVRDSKAREIRETRREKK